MKPHFEDRVCEMAENLALKQTGREFSDLPRSEQMRVWTQAEREVNDSIVDAAELRREALLDRKMGL